MINEFYFLNNDIKINDTIELDAINTNKVN